MQEAPPANGPLSPAAGRPFGLSPEAIAGANVLDPLWGPGCRHTADAAPMGPTGSCQLCPLWGQGSGCRFGGTSASGQLPTMSKAYRRTHMGGRDPSGCRLVLWTTNLLSAEPIARFRRIVVLRTILVPSGSNDVQDQMAPHRGVPRISHPSSFLLPATSPEGTGAIQQRARDILGALLVPIWGTAAYPYGAGPRIAGFAGAINLVGRRPIPYLTTSPPSLAFPPVSPFPYGYRP